MADASQENPRWYRLTPDRVVLGLLALEGFLWLSERYRWFPFNEHKGWTVLICLATVGTAFVLTFLWFLAAFVVRWRFQFSILSLLTLTVVVAAGCSWLAVEREPGRKQREAVEAILKAGGGVSYDYQRDPSGTPMPFAKPPEPAWLRTFLGDDLFVNVTEVGLDASLEVTDAWLEHLQGLTHLQVLSLAQTKVSDTGLEHLKELRQLYWLNLSSTNVTDAGVRDIQKALPNCVIRHRSSGI